MYNFFVNTNNFFCMYKLSLYSHIYPIMAGYQPNLQIVLIFFFNLNYYFFNLDDKSHRPRI